MQQHSLKKNSQVQFLLRLGTKRDGCSQQTPMICARMLGQPFVCFVCGAQTRSRCRRCKTFFCSRQCLAASWASPGLPHRFSCATAAPAAVGGRADGDPAPKRIRVEPCPPPPPDAPVITISAPPLPRAATTGGAPAETLWAVLLPTDERLDPVRRNALVRLHPSDATPSEVRRAMRGSIKGGIVLGPRTAHSEADRARLLRLIGLDQKFDGSYLMADSLAEAGFDAGETESLRQQVERWCALPQSAQMEWTAERLGVANLPPLPSEEEEAAEEKEEEEGERRELPHPIPPGTLTAIARGFRKMAAGGGGGAGVLPRGTFLGGYGGELARVDATANMTYKFSPGSAPPDAYGDDLSRRDELDAALRSAWCLDGLRRRSQLALINDVNGYWELVGPRRSPVDAERTAMFFDFWHRGLPQLGAVTVRDVMADSEVTVQYGEAYWYAMVTDSPKQLKAASDEEREAERARHDASALTLCDLDDVGMAIYNRMFSRPATAAAPESVPDRARRLILHLQRAMGFSRVEDVASPDLLLVIGPRDRADAERYAALVDPVRCARVIVADSAEKLPGPALARRPGRDVFVAAADLGAAADALARACAIDDVI